MSPPSIKEVHLLDQEEGLFSMLSMEYYPYRDKNGSYLDTLSKDP